MPHNVLEMSASDADRLGLRTADQVLVRTDHRNETEGGDTMVASSGFYAVVEISERVE